MPYVKRVISTGEYNILTPDEIKDSNKLQTVSLTNFMLCLGYEPVYYVNGILCFESDCLTNVGRSTISFHNAVKLHNTDYLDWHGKQFKEPFNFDAYKIKRALAARIVQVVNLQKNRKTGIIKPTSHIVKFVDEVYYKMWITSKQFPF